MTNDSPLTSIEKLLSLKYEKPFKCYDSAEEADKETFGIGNTYVPDHVITCEIPKKLWDKFGYMAATIKIHIIWLKNDTSAGFSGLVVDKVDNKIYFIVTSVDDSSGYCTFSTISNDNIMTIAKAYNPFLIDVINMSLTDSKKLLDYQIYSPFSDRFIYIEMALENKIALCGIGLHSNALLAVGWLGKLINKDLFVTYAECGFKEYEQIKKQNRSIYERALLMEKNQNLYSYYNTIFENRRKYDDLLDIIKKSVTEPLTQRKVAVFIASANGTEMKPYAGSASPWMEMAITQCQKDFGLIK